MRLATVKINGLETATIVIGDHVWLIEDINKKMGGSWKTNLFSLIKTGQIDELKNWYDQEGKGFLESHSLEALHKNKVCFGPLYRHPRKIWGIGLNYVEHANDLGELAPNTEPASFMRPDTTIIGPGETINIPHQSSCTTAEAELGIIIGKECKDIEESEVPKVVAGFTTIIDVTAEDILKKNPRYLTRAKSFDTFFSFGPQLVTLDEIKDLLCLKVCTMLNGNICRQNKVSNMIFNPWFLVSFHSKVMKLLPGDIISTGTPGAVNIRHGDLVECHIDGFERLVNRVVDLKVQQ